MFTYNNENYDLPVKTMAINDKIEQINNAKTTGEAYRKMLEFVLMALGKEKVNELLETVDIMQVNLIELNKLANAITIGYEDEVAKQQIERAERLTNSSSVQNIIEVGKSAQYLQKMNSKK